MKTYKIDKSKNIGEVIFVVEGGRPETGGTELRLLKKIFSDILGYQVHELRRGTDEFIGYGSNIFSKVFALNLPKNQLTQMNDDDIDSLFRLLRTNFNINTENCPIFYLYDRDYLSYKPNELRGKYVRRYTDPYINEHGDHGQLLLSYPSVESYVLSCILEDTYQKEYLLGKDLKPELIEYDFSEEKIISVEQLIHATTEMDKALLNFGVLNYDLDNLGETLLQVYDKQQEKCKQYNSFSLLSLISMALLELGIIVEIEELSS